MAPETSKDNEILSTILGSAAAGIIGRLPCHPFDTAKSKMQVQSALVQFGKVPEKLEPAHLHSKYLRNLTPKTMLGRILIGSHPEEIWQKPFKNTFDALSKVFRREGLVGLYRGLVITSLGSIPGTSLYLTSFEVARREIAKSRVKGHELVTDFFAGIFAEIVSCVFWVPIDVIKERFQIQSLAETKSRYTGPITAMVSISKTEGFRGLYRAYGATVASFGPYSGCYLALYQKQKSLWKDFLKVKNDKDVPKSIFIISSFLAGGAAAWITNPLDLAKLRMQVNRGPMGFSFPYTNMLDGLIKIKQQEGVVGLWRGSGARAVFFSFSTSITIPLFEIFRIKWKEILYD